MTQISLKSPIINIRKVNNIVGRNRLVAVIDVKTLIDSYRSIAVLRTPPTKLTVTARCCNHVAHEHLFR
jgi:hypothetical protein